MPTKPVLYARCEQGLYDATELAAKREDRSIGSFIRRAVLVAVEKTAGIVPIEEAPKKKLARRKQRG